MDFIAAMKEVWMESERRKWSKEEWERQKETHQWEQPMRGHDECGISRPDIPPEMRPLERTGARRRMGAYGEINRVMDQVTDRFGSLGGGSFSMPPEYSDYVNYPAQSSETIPKLVNDMSNASSTVPASNEKTPLSTDRNGEEEEESHPGGETMTMTSQEKNDLLDTIKKLAKEQELLKAKMEEHDEHLMTILSKQPLMRKRLSVTSQMMVTTKRTSSDAFSATDHPGLDKKTHGEEDRIYAQIEELYTNLCRIRFPVHEKKRAAQYMTLDVATQQYTSPSDSPPVPVNMTNHRHYQNTPKLGELNLYSTPSSFDMEMVLYRENVELKEKIKSLEKQIEELKTTDNDIESLKFAYGSSSGTCSIATFVTDTTDNNMSFSCPCPTKSDVQNVSSSFEWTITNYFEKLELEKWGKNPSLHSEPFYTEQSGYRASLELYLNGNGSGHDKRMSVFLSIIKSHHDDHLQWPVTFFLSFILLNQEENNVDSLMHEATFKFNKPSGDSHDKRDTWGVIEFVPHSVINTKKYIKDDAITLKIRMAKV